jgi:glycosyltransferase involved in cell wall biosynthesis
MSYGRALFDLIRGEDWDVVHAWEEPFIMAGWQIARAVRRPEVLVFSTFQNLPKRYPPPFSQMERYCLTKAAGWTAYGQTIAEALRDRPGYRDKPMRTIPVGVDLDLFRPDPQSGAQVRAHVGWVESGPPVIGFVGRFVPEKGLQLLMRILDRLPRGSWRALFVGEGPMEASLRSWAASHSDAVRVEVGVRHSQVPEHLNSMDLLIAPSQTTRRWREQFGRMLVEAMACGVPVIASDSGEIPNVVANAGIIVPEADEDAWVAAVQELVLDPNRRRKLRDSGIARVQESFAWPLIGRAFIDFFEELASLPA